MALFQIPIEGPSISKHSPDAVPEVPGTSPPTFPTVPTKCPELSLPDLVYLMCPCDPVTATKVKGADWPALSHMSASREETTTMEPNGVIRIQGCSSKEEAAIT